MNHVPYRLSIIADVECKQLEQKRLVSKTFMEIFWDTFWKKQDLKSIKKETYRETKWSPCFLPKICQNFDSGYNFFKLSHNLHRFALCEMVRSA